MTNGEGNRDTRRKKEDITKDEGERPAQPPGQDGQQQSQQP